MEQQPDVEALLARANQPSADAMRLHPWYRGKLEVTPKCAIRSIEDFAIWYTPGVAAPCREIAQHPDTVFDHTNKGNMVAIVSDGSRVLGLGDIGPHAALPVTEGKALLFKYLGGVDAFPLCLPREAAAVGLAAMAQGVVRVTLSREALVTQAATRIKRAQDMTRVLMERGIIALPH